MHAIQLLEVAKIFAFHAETEVTYRNEPSKEACHAYWMASRFRHENWARRIQEHRTQIAKVGVGQRLRRWTDMAPLLQEILLAEPLTRCVAHHAAALASLDVECDLPFLSRSVLGAHVESRQRCLHLMVFGNGIPVELLSRLNRIRQACERFCDHIRAWMTDISSRNKRVAQELAFEASTTEELRQATLSGESKRWHASTLSEWFIRHCALDLDYRASNAEYNAAIARAVVGLFGEKSFDSFGVLKSPGFARLQVESCEGAFSAPKGQSPSLESKDDFLISLPSFESMKSEPLADSDDEETVGNPHSISTPLDILFHPTATAHEAEPEVRRPHMLRRWN